VSDEDRTKQLEETNKALEVRLADLERRLMAEREKSLSAAVKSEDEKAASVSVETALKDMQEKLRRDKREQDLDSARQAAEGRARDLERRLSEERDMWVTMMKEHLARGGDTKPLLQEISALKADLAKRDEQVSAMKEQALKGGGDHKILQKEITSLKDLLAKQESELEAKADEIRLLTDRLVVKDKDADVQTEELTLKLTSIHQSLAEKEAENDELRRQAESSRQEADRVLKAAQSTSSAAKDLERDRDIFHKRLKEQQVFQDRLTARVEELEREVGQRDALIQTVRAENEGLQKKLSQLTEAKDAEARLMRENLQRLGRQNKELLTKLQEAVQTAEAGVSRGAPGPVAPNMQEMLSSLEDALTQRDRVLEDQQKSIEEKRGLIEGLFGDLRSLDEQAVALLEEKGRQTQQMNERISALNSENDRLRRMLESRPPVPEAAPAAPPAAPVAEASAVPTDTPG
jgi:DNA repair exonuclease SbcCD ATPase subunit